MKAIWIKPSIKVKTLKLRTLLGENGWLQSTKSNPIACIISGVYVSGC
jgi:hypothetical protein